MKIETARRSFKFNGRTLSDVNPAFTPERIKALYAATHPELTTAEISEPVRLEDGTIEYTFRRSIGAKG